jgi:hypothetical protein
METGSAMASEWKAYPYIGECDSNAVTKMRTAPPLATKQSRSNG